jgi:hypothetical protein
MATYIKIASNTVGAGGAASVTFSSIPGTYTDLVIKASIRGDSGTGGFGNNLVSFNSISSGYSQRILYGLGSGAAVAASSSATSSLQNAAYGSDAGATANTFGNTEIYIPNYTSSDFKSISSDSVSENNATTAIAAITAGLLSNTAAITSITMTSGFGNFGQYSTFTLYGISNA